MYTIARPDRPGAETSSGCTAAGAMRASPRRLPDGDLRRGAEAVRRFGCGCCQVVPGIPGARGQVGSPLAGIGGRAYIAGASPTRGVAWRTGIPDLRGVDSLTAMPNLG